MNKRILMQGVLLAGLVLDVAGFAADSAMPSNSHHELPKGVMKKDPGETS